MAWSNIKTKGWESHTRAQHQQKGGVQKKSTLDALLTSQ